MFNGFPEWLSHMLCFLNDCTFRKAGTVTTLCYEKKAQQVRAGFMKENVSFQKLGVG